MAQTEPERSYSAPSSLPISLVCQAVALWVPRSYLLLDARLSYKLCAALTRHSNAIFATQLTNERIGRTGRSRITAAGKT